MFIFFYINYILRQTYVLAFVGYYVGGIGITAGYHRLFSHRSYEACYAGVYPSYPNKTKTKHKTQNTKYNNKYQKQKQNTKHKIQLECF